MSAPGWWEEWRAAPTVELAMGEEITEPERLAAWERKHGMGIFELTHEWDCRGGQRTARLVRVKRVEQSDLPGEKEAAEFARVVEKALEGELS